MSNNRTNKFRISNLWRHERGAVMMLFTIFIPFMVGILTLAVDAAHIYHSRAMLQAAAESAALAAASQLPSRADAVSTAKSYAAKNMPQNPYGNILADIDISVGYWPNTCSG